MTRKANKPAKSRSAPVVAAASPKAVETEIMEQAVLFVTQAADTIHPSGLAKKASKARNVDDAAVAAAFRSLEGSTFDLAHMAGILADMIEDLLGDPGTDRVTTGRENTVFIMDARRDQYLFAANHLQQMANSLRDKFYAAYDGEKVGD